jgi:hypothetical protein
VSTRAQAPGGQLAHRLPDGLTARAAADEGTEDSPGRGLHGQHGVNRAWQKNSLLSTTRWSPVAAIWPVRSSQ